MSNTGRCIWVYIYIFVYYISVLIHDTTARGFLFSAHLLQFGGSQDFLRTTTGNTWVPNPERVFDFCLFFFFLNLPSLKLTASLPLKMDGWNPTFLLGRPISGAMLVSGRVFIFDLMHNNRHRYFYDYSK